MTDQSIDTRELERKSQDRIKVLNPTDKELKVVWDGYAHKVPAKGDATLPRYLANKYIREQATAFLVNKQDEAVSLENEKRRKSGKEEMEKWQGGDQEVFEGKFRFAHGVNNPEALRMAMKMFYGGLVEEYGLDMRAEKEEGRDNRRIEDVLLEDLERETPQVDDNVASKEKGIEKDKKSELISKISQ
jgi:hypothetical protein